ncbi:MAG: SUF system NifU family Fe-S cluster assembly protein [Deltaproteobacteria bacterium]|nr:SUF system NifU family Fe-S cluster assembly protein [Deltaproteobacteria bacterium]
MLSTADPLDALYRDVVLEHYRKPRNRKPLNHPSASALVQNPLCGDQVRVEIRLERARLSEVSVRARGCSITVAAGSVMTELVRGCDAQEVRGLMTALQQIVYGEPAPSALDERLRAFARVAQLPARERCALLPWEGLVQALESDSSAA